MSFIGTVGVVAQQGNQGAAPSAPTSVSIATTSSGNYDDAVIVLNNTLGSGGENALASNNGSTFSSNSGSIVLVYGGDYSAGLNNNSGLLELHTQGYLRATGATSFAWAIKSVAATDSTSALSTIADAGSPSTDQDETGVGDHIGKTVRAYHNSGGRGYMVLQSGDDITWVVRATATNSNGDTFASDVNVTIDVT
jgi:hypothetical protein